MTILCGFHPTQTQAAHNMVFTQGHGFVLGASFGLKRRSLRCRVLACNAADTASLATRFLFGKLIGVAITFGFGEKRCRKNLPLCDLSDLESNPYQTPTNNNAVDAATSSPRHSPVRFWLYCHLAALCVTGVFSLVDSRIIQLPNASIDVIQWLIFPSLAALFVCPIAILVCILRPTVTPSQRLAIVVLETIVVLAHLFALLPAVQ